MINKKLQNNLNWQLLRVAINAKHGLITVAEKNKLSVMQMYTLCLLQSDTSISMNSLSTQINCDASNVTGIIDRLFQQKYIKREENPNDRRTKLITLTPKGTKLTEKIMLDVESYKLANIEKLSAAQRKQLSELLSLISNTD